MLAQNVEKGIVTKINDIIQNISPFDRLEENHQAETLEWLGQTDNIFRTQKPAIPPKHLVSYFIPFDQEAQKILLVDHKQAQLWLPPGGHVEPNEHPESTVLRECKEELGIHADFWCDDPIFLTSKETVGLTGGHIDVSLWYILKGNSKQTYIFDEREFHAIAWFDFDRIPFEVAEPHMKRFLEKFTQLIGV